jgi:hypothetical protein
LSMKIALGELCGSVRAPAAVAMAFRAGRSPQQPVRTHSGPFCCRVSVLLILFEIFSEEKRAVTG